MTTTPDQVVRHDVAFLHTSAVHVLTFDKLMQELAPALRGTHTICETLLTQAQHDRADSPTLGDLKPTPGLNWAFMPTLWPAQCERAIWVL